MFQNTFTAIAQIPKPEIVLWAEESVQVDTIEEEADLIANASAIAQNSSVFLGIAYFLNTNPAYNKFGSNPFSHLLLRFLVDHSVTTVVLISDVGVKLIDYKKSHPVPGMENITAGPAVLSIFLLSFAGEITMMTRFAGAAIRRHQIRAHRCRNLLRLQLPALHLPSLSTQRRYYASGTFNNVV